ncbi:MAG: hypothetical protein KAY37_08140 [Phycisphaerae bacterium]|nr:hypothetical protein [Phycisphaerae bacterium]
MHARTLVLGFLAALASAWPTQQALGDLTSATGKVTAELTEYRAGEIGEQDQVSETYPETSAVLPLQVVARLVDEEEQAAAVAAAQFADPTTASLPNPEEFALTLVLNSISPEISYRGQATAGESRRVLYSPTDFSPAAVGDTVDVTGRMYLDGALAVFAGNNVTDLTGASLTLRVTVMLESAGQSPRQVFVATLEVKGGPNRKVDVTAGGRFPTNGVFRADLSGIDEQLGVFESIVFPTMILDYPYTAPLGQTFTLKAQVEVDAANTAGQVGVAALIGTPVTSLNEAIAATQGEPAASKMVTALQQERTQPTGEPAFEDEPDDDCLLSLFPACGLFGFEAVLGMLALVGLRAANPYQRRTAC